VAKPRSSPRRRTIAGVCAQRGPRSTGDRSSHALDRNNGGSRLDVPYHPDLAVSNGHGVGIDADGVAHCLSQEAGVDLRDRFVTVVTYPPPAPFVVATDIEGADWLDEALAPLGHAPPLVGEIVPSGFEAYARLLHPARRFFGPSIVQSVPLRWSEIAAARGKTVHPEMRLEALIDRADGMNTSTGRRSARGAGSGSLRSNGSRPTRVTSSSRSFARAPRRAKMRGSCCGRIRRSGARPHHSRSSIHPPGSLR